MNDAELDEYRENLSHDDLATSLLGGWRQPEWFEKMLIYTLLVDNDNGAPSHLMWLSEPGTGKSKDVNSALRSLGEAQKSPFKGSGSTIKGLTPSFKDSPPEEGYLLRTQRLAGVDEKMDLLSNTVQQNNGRVADVFRKLLDLLEHEESNFQSGNGSVKGQMASVMWAVGNINAYGINSMQDLGEQIDDAYLSRMLIYNQIDSHVEWISRQKTKVSQRMMEEGIEEDDLYPEQDDQFISMIDTMQESKRYKADLVKVDEIFEEIKGMVPGYMRVPYRSRYKRHFKNMLAGIVKYNYIINNRDNFKATEEDYKELKSLMETVVSSWGGVDIKEMSEDAIKRALTPAQRRVFNCIDESPGIEAKQLADKAEVQHLGREVSRLEELELVARVEDEDDVPLLYPYWTEEAEEVFDDNILI